MKGDRPQSSASLPGKVGAGQLVSSGVAPRPRSPSITDEITSPGHVIPAKGLTPRTPTISRADAGEMMVDARTAALAAAKEITAPFEARIADLEERLEQLEALAKRAAAPAATRAMPMPMIVAPPPVSVGAPSGFGSPVSAVPVSVAVPTSGPTSVVASPPPVLQVVQETHLSQTELEIFNGGKRHRRVVIYFVLVLLLAAGVLAASAIISRQ